MHVLWYLSIFVSFLPCQSKWRTTFSSWSRKKKNNLPHGSCCRPGKQLFLKQFFYKSLNNYLTFVGFFKYCFLMADEIVHPNGASCESNKCQGSNIFLSPFSMFFCWILMDFENVICLIEGPSTKRRGEICKGKWTFALGSFC